MVHLRRRAGARLGAGHVGQPRSGLRLAGAGAGPARRARGRGDRRRGSWSTVDGAGADDVPARRDAPGRARHARRLRGHGRQPAGLRLSLQQRRSRTREVSGRRRPRSSAAWPWPALWWPVAGCCSTTTAVFRLAAGIEGHPDNVAPACHGGFVISGRDERRLLRRPVVRRPPDHGVSCSSRPTRCPPSCARGLLPDAVPHAEAAADAGRAALLVAALAAARTACCERPATTCTRSTAVPPCPARSPWWTGCAPTAWPRWSPVPGRPCWR